MRSSDQRYFHVQRVKRDVTAVSECQAEIVLALRVARQDPSALENLANLIRASAAEFSHLLLACGRTATDFRRNFRRGPAAHNIIYANDLADMASLQVARLDGFAVIRLSKEQARTVKAKWRKLRDQDHLVHDPQGQVWTALMSASLSGDCSGLDHLAGLRAGEQLALARLRGDKEAAYAWFRERDLRERANVHNPDFIEPDHIELEAMQCFSWALNEYQMEWRKPGAWENPGAVRKRIECNLVVAEAFAAGKGFAAAYGAPDTSGRHCSERRLRQRLQRVDEQFGDRWRWFIDGDRAWREEDRNARQALTKLTSINNAEFTPQP